MMDKFLKAKHWQLFLLICVLPMLAQFFFMNSFRPNSSMEYGSPREEQVESFMFYLVISAISVAMYFVWLWSVAIGIQKAIPGHLKLKVNRFKVWLIISAIGLIYMGVLFMLPERLSGAIALSAFILNFTACIGIFYSMYFVAKSLSRAEAGGKTSLGDFFGEFLLVWFFPIGVWILQPRINRIQQGYSNKSTQ